MHGETERSEEKASFSGKLVSSEDEAWCSESDNCDYKQTVPTAGEMSPLKKC